MEFKVKMRLFIGLCGLSLTLIACETEEVFNECSPRIHTYIAAHLYRGSPEAIQDQSFMAQLRNSSIDECDKDYSLNENRVKCKEKGRQSLKDAELKGVFTNPQQYDSYETETERQCPTQMARLKEFWKK